jgi:hypothetical protein
VQPGSIPFRFSTSDGLQSLVHKLEETAGWGEIIGPHGCGKSTLFATLLPAITRWQVRHVRLSTSERALPAWAWDRSDPSSLLAIDGFEQLGFFTRWRMKRHCRQHHCGLVVTAHRSMGLPTLYRTDVSLEMAKEVVAGLIPAGGEWVLDGFDLAARLRYHRGSLREVLFELYDRWNGKS